jgi:hypothetical protein
MPDIEFHFDFQPANPAEHAARMAVLYRLMVPEKGRPCVPKDALSSERAFTRAMGLWRRRVTELSRRGVHHFGSQQVQRARNCHPYGVAVKTYGRAAVYCRHQGICPWCLGRAANELYTLVQRVLQEGDALVSITCVDFFGGTVTRAFLHERLVWARMVMEALALANSKVSRTVAWNVVAEPPTFHRGHENDFAVRSRFLMILPLEKPTLLAQTTETWTNARCHNPNEKEVQRTIARVCAYPVGLLTGSAEATQLVLEARAGLRLSEMMGALRGMPAELANDTPSENSNSTTRGEPHGRIARAAD